MDTQIKYDVLNGLCSGTSVRRGASVWDIYPVEEHLPDVANAQLLTTAREIARCPQVAYNH